MDKSSISGPKRSNSSVSQMNGSGPRRPQTLVPSSDQDLTEPPKPLKLIIHKDSNGYGMKVSGDTPVYVESVKAGGAAQKAGLVAGDMIVKVNGTHVEFSEHADVVRLIKSSAVVELTVKRKMNRPSSISIQGPSTPLAQRGGITAPLPVDHAKRREMEFSKVKTLRLMLDQEKKTLDSLQSNNGSRQEMTRAETTINKLQEQLRQVCGEDPALKLIPTPILMTPSPQTPQPVIQTSTTPAFLSRFPRSLSSLSLGTRKKPAEKESPVITGGCDLTNLNVGGNGMMSQQTQQLSSPQQQTQQQLQQQQSHSKKKSSFSMDRNSKNDIPPPLPQRNQPRKSISPEGGDTSGGGDSSGSRRNTPVSDLDHSMPNSPTGVGTNNNNNNNTNSNNNNTNNNNKNHNIGGVFGSGGIINNNNNSNNVSSKSSSKKRTKAKAKALSDPKMSSQMFIQMESMSEDTSLIRSEPCFGSDDSDPPPLPPRQPGLMTEEQSGMNNNINNNITGSTNKLINNNNNVRPLPNSIDSVMNYPLIATCTTVRDNMAAAFPLSNRPNIVLQLHHHQQHLNRHHSSNSVNTTHLNNNNNNISNHHARSIMMGGGGHHHPHHLLGHHPSQPMRQHQQQQPYQHHQHHHHLHQNLPPYSSNKSTALGLTPHQMNQIGSKHRRVVSSPEHLQQTGDHQSGDRHQKTGSGTWELSEKDNEKTPPGTPPPPYLSPLAAAAAAGGGGGISVQQQHLNEEIANDVVFDSPHTAIGSQVVVPPSGQISAAQANAIQKPIISMEDDEISDQESIVEEHGPFRSLQQLLEPENSAHLAVFLNFVFSNSDPAPLLFYLITGLYKEGTVKDMRKWAYEIHSTFLVPRAPLLWSNVEESLAREVDEVLQNEYDKGEILRKVFWKSRVRAREFINVQLQEFQVKRTAGLGTMYGPSDQQLQEAKGDKNKEQKIVEETILPKLQILVDEIDREPNECPKNSALCSALSTVLHRIFVTRSNPNSLIDRIHHFVSREKSFKNRIMGKKTKEIVRGHHFLLRQYYEVTHCNHCQNIIWGVSPQGYRCTYCGLNIHRACSRILEENCPGPAPQKQHDNKWKFMEKIRPTHHANQERARRLDEEGGEDIFIERPTSTSVVRQPSDRRPDSGGGGGGISGSIGSIGNNSMTGSIGGGITNAGFGGGSIGGSNNIITGSGITSIASDLLSSHANDNNAFIGLNVGGNSGVSAEHRSDSSKSKSAPVSVSRSESYKERLSQKRNRTNRRKTSDPSLSKTNDDQGELGLTSNLTQSSNSSLSSGLDSPSTSLEAVTAPTTAGGAGTIAAPRQWVESEDEGAGGELEADWSSNVTADILQALSDGEKKRQEVINEIYVTERNHVRTLRLLEGIFMRPMQESGCLTADILLLLFPPALLTLKDLHSTFESQLKQRRVEHGSLVGDIGDLLLAMFDGRSGEDLRENAAQFCARQQIALEALKERRRKDESLQRLLTKAESHKACRRLQLKDLLPTALQRLTKYPLLFESLYKVTVRLTPDNETEAQAIKKALDSSRRILDHVNQAVRVAEDAHKLQTIQRKLDKSGLEKEASNEFKNLDLTQYKLIHDGPLIMKKNPGTQLHGLLFENMMVLLHKQDDKYLLKYHSSPGSGSGESKSIEGRFNPITRVNLILVRQSAVDKNTFFLINTNVSQMLELSAPSSSECKAWFKHISDAAEAYKQRTRGVSHDISGSPGGTIVASSANADQESINSSTTAGGMGSCSTASMTSSISSSSLTASQLSNQGGLALGKDSASSATQPSSTFENISSAPDPAIATTTPFIGQPPPDPHQATASTPTLTTTAHGDEDKDDGANDNEDKHRDDGDDDEKNQNERHRRRRTSSGNSITLSPNSNFSSSLLLTQQCSLVAPSEVQISVSPALIAEPVLTPAEQLRRLDESIRMNLAEKQKIICDMFKVPNEHFAAIADIAGQPEAPKEPSDIVLAAFAQIQSMTETLNDCIKVTAHQEISAVSTSLCDECHRTQLLPATRKNNNRQLSQPITIQPPPITNLQTSTSASSSPATGTAPLPPAFTTILTENDDGYCEIVDLRNINSSGTNDTTIGTSRLNSTNNNNNNLNNHNNNNSNSNNSSNNNINNRNSQSDDNNVVKRQSTISAADSIVEETEHEISCENNDNEMFLYLNKIVTNIMDNDGSGDVNGDEDIVADDKKKSTPKLSQTLSTQSSQNDNDGVNDVDGGEYLDGTTRSTTLHNQLINECNNLLLLHQQHSSTDELFNNDIDDDTDNNDDFINNTKILCGTNRLMHAQQLAPSVPCYLIANYVTSISLQISQLLPKLNERDLERENLRRENQNLRELLNTMHDKQNIQLNSNNNNNNNSNNNHNINNNNSNNITTNCNNSDKVLENEETCKNDNNLVDNNINTDNDNKNDDENDVDHQQQKQHDADDDVNKIKFEALVTTQD